METVDCGERRGVVSKSIIEMYEALMSAKM